MFTTYATYAWGFVLFYKLGKWDNKVVNDLSKVTGNEGVMTRSAELALLTIWQCYHTLQIHRIYSSFVVQSRCHWPVTEPSYQTWSLICGSGNSSWWRLTPERESLCSSKVTPSSLGCSYSLKPYLCPALQVPLWPSILSIWSWTLTSLSQAETCSQVPLPFFWFLLTRSVSQAVSGSDSVGVDKATAVQRSSSGNR